MKLISSWSGGKDSCYALMLALKEQHELKALLNVMNENGRISRSHGIPLEILKDQASAIGTDLNAVASDWKHYEENFVATLKDLKARYGAEAVVFGDIDLQPHREWEEKVCRLSGLGAQLPLWKRDRRQLVYDMLDSGIRALIVSCNTTLGEDFLGKEITSSLVEKLENKGVDVCGENGEYHTLVVDCPLFDQALDIAIKDTHIHQDYCFIDWKHEV